MFVIIYIYINVYKIRNVYLCIYIFVQKQLPVVTKSRLFHNPKKSKTIVANSLRSFSYKYQENLL